MEIDDSLFLQHFLNHKYLKRTTRRWASLPRWKGRNNQLQETRRSFSNVPMRAISRTFISWRPRRSTGWRARQKKAGRTTGRRARRRKASRSHSTKGRSCQSRWSRSWSGSPYPAFATPVSTALILRITYIIVQKKKKKPKTNLLMRDNISSRQSRFSALVPYLEVHRILYRTNNVVFHQCNWKEVFIYFALLATRFTDFVGLLVDCF